MFRELSAKVVFAERSEEEQEWEFLLFCMEKLFDCYTR